jgi:hypothetical protein
MAQVMQSVSWLELYRGTRVPDIEAQPIAGQLVSADFRAIGSTQRLGRVIVGVRTWISMFGGWFGRWRVEMLSLACCGLAV